MASPKDFSDPFREEMLTQMADTFFGSRKALEEEMDLVLAYAKTLRDRQAEVEGCASLLHYMLVGRREAETFWSLLDIDAGVLLTETPPVPSRRLLRRPFALTARRRYQKWIGCLYAALRDERNAYMDGEGGSGQDAADLYATVYYRLVEEMTALVNKRVRRLNRSGSVSTALQTAKQLDPAQVDRERITGATSELFSPGFEKKLCYRPIDFFGLGIKAFPALPAWKNAQRRVGAFIDQCHRKHAGEIHRRMARQWDARDGIDKRA